jgi:hypothetical protein
MKPPSIEHWSFIAATLYHHHKRNGRRRQAVFFLRLYRTFHRDKMLGAVPDARLAGVRDGDPYGSDQAELPLFSPPSGRRRT